MKRIFFLLVGLLILQSGTILAGGLHKISYTRTLNFSFKVDKNAQFNLSNEYGDIHLYRWDKNVISVTVAISVKADNEDAAQRIANGIQIKKSQNGNRVYLKTDYSNKGNANSFWNLFFGGGLTTKKSISIDYKVYLPSSLGTLNVQNKYGAVEGKKIPGVSHFKLSYCQFHLSDIYKPLYLDAKYGEGSLTEVNNATIEAAYTDFYLDKIRQLKMHYEYGDVNIDQAGSVLLDGSYGDIEAGQISELRSNTNYSDYEIDFIEKSAIIATAYGDVEIKKTGSGLQNLHVTLRYSDLYVSITKGIPVTITASLQYGDIDADLSGLQIVKDIQKGTHTYYKAHSSDTGGTIIQIDGQYSDVELENE